ncbi:MAG TPA: hypothetical protein VJQ54_13840 [Candidatus Sulfotelmatobacter sp.]|nr:hypothetical protein [Candidatus Sulfotelmatobacter sp.]
MSGSGLIILLKRTRVPQQVVRCFLLLVLLNSIGRANAADTRSDADKDSEQQTIKALIERVNALEARVQQLEAIQNHSAIPLPVSQPMTSLTPVSLGARIPQPAGAPADTAPRQVSPPEPESTERSETERMDLSKTLLRIRGFGDVTLHGDNYHPAGQPGDKTAFSLGQLNLFVTSDISDRFRFLSEVVFEAGPDNIYGQNTGTANTFGVDVERYLLQYSYNDYLNISAGRYHTAIGYYNTAYHHSTWLQTTTDRPLMFQFEDRGGILPIHNVGVEAFGKIPSGALGLHYIAEVGNGRSSRAPLAQEPVQNEVDEQTHKAVNFEVFARPVKLPGLQLGFSAYRDLLVPLGQPTVGETILATHAIYSTPAVEWLNELLVVRHNVSGTSHVFQTPAFYSQISKAFGQYRPYFRYQYINASPAEPIFPDVALRAGPSAGIRYDATESVALKFQYDYLSLRNQRAVQGLEAQLGFTF